MDCNKLHLINSNQGCNAIIHGSSFGFSPVSNGIQIFIENVDLNNWTILGDIKKTPDITAEKIASFTFSNPIYQPQLINNVSVNGTSFTMRLNPIQSLLLIPMVVPFPLIKNVADIDKYILENKIIFGTNCYVYDVKAQHPNGYQYGFEPIIEPSVIQVIGSSTNHT